MTPVLILINLKFHGSLKKKSISSLSLEIKGLIFFLFDKVLEETKYISLSSGFSSLDTQVL